MNAGTNANADRQNSINVDNAYFAAIPAQHLKRKRVQICPKAIALFYLFYFSYGMIAHFALHKFSKKR